MKLNSIFAFDVIIFFSFSKNRFDFLLLFSLCFFKFKLDEFPAFQDGFHVTCDFKREMDSVLAG